MQKTVAQISYRFLSKTLAVMVGTQALIACVVAAPPPYDEFVLARSAVRAAQDVDSARFSTGLWNRAEENYRNGSKAFKDADYKEAKVFFSRAIEYAERAENATRLKKFQSGDSFP